MFSKIKTLLTSKPNPEQPKSDFKHPEMGDGNMAECPFMSKQKNNATAPKK